MSNRDLNLDFPGLAEELDREFAISRLTAGDKDNDPQWMTVDEEVLNRYQTWLWGQPVNTLTKWRGVKLRKRPPMNAS